MSDLADIQPVDLVEVEPDPVDEADPAMAWPPECDADGEAL